MSDTIIDTRLDMEALHTLPLRQLRAALLPELEALDPSIEYFSVSLDWKDARGDQPIGRYRWIACYAVTGGSEGHYVHVDRVYLAHEYDREFTHEAIFLYKTFGGWEAACQVAAYLGERLGA